MLAAQPDFEVVGMAGDGQTAVQSKPGPLSRCDPHGLAHARPGWRGGDRGHPGAQRPGAHILVLTTYDSDADIVRAIEAGATGYLLKDTPREELYRAIRAAARGESVLAPAVASPPDDPHARPGRGKPERPGN